MATLTVHIQQRPFDLACMALSGRRCHCALLFEFSSESFLGVIQRGLQLLAVDGCGFDLALLGGDFALGSGQFALQTNDPPLRGLQLLLCGAQRCLR